MDWPALTALGAPRIGTLEPGALDAITDVAGVSVGHVTLADGPMQTGVTVLRPQPGNLFLHKLPAGLDVINGFGKSTGLMQVDELGALESPIVLTSTFGVGTASLALIRDAIARNPELARSLPTVNPLVLECNDGWLNDAQMLSLKEQNVQETIGLTNHLMDKSRFKQGSVGAGRGMSCHGLKGGIGTASRCVTWQGQPHTVGALVLANQGRPDALTVDGHRVGPALQAMVRQRLVASESVQPERGSILMLLATDAPLDARQLRRLARRAGAGLARTGSDFGHGSGDIALAFSTAYRVPQQAGESMPMVQLLHESALDLFFQAAADATEQAILHALFSATTVTGRDGHCRLALRELAPDWRAFLAGL